MLSEFSIIISAPSGAGKTTLIQRLIEGTAAFEFSVSTTTRPQRPGEVPGKSYYYVTNEEFMDMVDQGMFLEWALVHGNSYGTTKKEIDRIRAAGKIPIFDIDVQGARNLQQKIENVVSIFIVPPSRKILEERLRKRRSESESQIALRLRNAIQELKEYERYDYLVVNDSLDTAVEQLKAIVTAEQVKKDRMASIITEILEDK